MVSDSGFWACFDLHLTYNISSVRTRILWTFDLNHCRSLGANRPNNTVSDCVSAIADGVIVIAIVLGLGHALGHAMRVTAAAARLAKSEFEIMFLSWHAMACHDIS